MYFLLNLLSTKMTSAFVLVILLCIQGCSGDSTEVANPVYTPEDIIKHSRLELLSDEPYLFPAISPDITVETFQKLRKWDFIFVGGLGNTYEDRGITSSLIPGDYDHVLVYLGKDSSGNAYAAELNVDSLQIVFTSLNVEGGIRLYCLGTDYGKYVHPTGVHLFRKNYYRIRWAKTFKEPFRINLRLYDLKLTSQVTEDLQAKFPYQLEFNKSFSAMILNKKLELIDDGRLNGAGCADYWTSLFEESARICIKGSRLKAAEMMAYFMYDPEGMSAIIPSALNPFGAGDVLVRDLLVTQGITVVDSPAHQFSCDGSSEQGLVTPTKLFSCDQLENAASVIN